jgi:hypothetical protein
VPEVYANVLYLAIREVHFADDASFLAHSSARNRALLETPMNRVLFWVARPKDMLRAAGLRWGTLHRGSSIRVRIRNETSAEMELRFPPYLFPEIVLRGTGTGFAVALENSGARDVVGDLQSLEPTRALFAAQWRRG